MKINLVLSLILSFYFTSLSALDFIADAVMSQPGQLDSLTRVYYSPNKIRKEYVYYGEPVIQILNAQKSVNLMCFSQQQLCYENEMLEKIDTGYMKRNQNPCAGISNVSCEKIADELLNKRQSAKWKISRIEGEGEAQKIFTSYIWVDNELNIPVKNLENNKTSVELIWLNSEMLGPRQTEKWLEVVSTPYGVQKRQQWFDKELKISIKQTYPDGRSQELKNIQISAFNNELFEIPFGYKRQVVNK